MKVARCRSKGSEVPCKSIESAVRKCRKCRPKVKTASMFVKTKAMFIKTKALIDKSKAVSEELLSRYAKYGLIVLLSSNAYIIIEKILNHLGISPTLFNDIICSDRYPYESPFNKKKAMEFLSKRYDVPFTQTISIGDRYETDIKPMTELGGGGILIKNTSSLVKVLEDYKRSNLSSCGMYEYYE